VAASSKDIFVLVICGQCLDIIGIGIVVDIARRVVFIIVGEYGLLLVLAWVRLRVASLEGAWTAIR